MSNRSDARDGIDLITTNLEAVGKLLEQGNRDGANIMLATAQAAAGQAIASALLDVADAIRERNTL